MRCNFCSLPNPCPACCPFNGRAVVAPPKPQDLPERHDATPPQQYTTTHSAPPAPWTWADDPRRFAQWLTPTGSGSDA